MACKEWHHTFGGDRSTVSPHSVSLPLRSSKYERPGYLKVSCTDTHTDVGNWTYVLLSGIRMLGNPLVGALRAKEPAGPLVGGWLWFSLGNWRSYFILGCLLRHWLLELAMSKQNITMWRLHTWTILYFVNRNEFVYDKVVEILLLLAYC